MNPNDRWHGGGVRKWDDMTMDRPGGGIMSIDRILRETILSTNDSHLENESLNDGIRVISKLFSSTSNPSLTLYARNVTLRLLRERSPDTIHSGNAKKF
jgi:hypothetical protein